MPEKSGRISPVDTNRINSNESFARRVRHSSHYVTLNVSASLMEWSNKMIIRRFYDPLRRVIGNNRQLFKHFFFRFFPHFSQQKGLI